MGSVITMGTIKLEIENSLKDLPEDKRREFLLKCISFTPMSIKPSLRNYVPGEPVIRFWSNAGPPYYSLSNFAFIEGGIEHQGYTYLSTEHAFQAQKYIKEQRIRFSTQGDLGNWDSIKLVFKKDLVEGKSKFWFKKENIGIIAKMATNKQVGKQLGLIRDESFNSTFELWKPILYKSILHLNSKILSETRDNYLLEFERGAQRSGSIWGGLISNGVEYGNNIMGKYLMKIREQIK